MKRFIFALLFTLVSSVYSLTNVSNAYAVVSADAPHIVKDVIPGSDGQAAGAIAFNGSIYFVQFDATQTSKDLWKSDGTEDGTVTVKTFCNGGGIYSDLFKAGDLLYFYAISNCITGDTDLWKSDGTTIGTEMVKGDIDIPFYLFTDGVLPVIGNTIYFTAMHPTLGYELWKSDGTESGTAMIKDIYVGGNSMPSNFKVIGNTLYFSAKDSVNGRELWKSDGTEVGTVMVKDIYPGVTDSVPSSFVVLGTELFFTANDGVSGNEIWKTDGTEVGTTIVKDIYTGVFGTSYNLTVMNGNIYFTAEEGVNGYELWKTDGTEVGTTLVKDIYVGVEGSIPDTFFASGDLLYFRANDGINGKALWVTDGSALGTFMLHDFTPDFTDSEFSNFYNKDDTLYFIAVHSIYGKEVWRTKGSSATTFVLSDLNPGNYGTDFLPATTPIFVELNNNLYFVPYSADYGYELWVIPYDNTPPIPSDYNIPSGSTISVSNPVMTFKINEPGLCRMSLSDLSFGQMSSSYCTQTYSTSITCNVPNLGSPGEKDIYVACKDLEGNKDSSSTNRRLDITRSIINIYTSADEQVTPSDPGDLINESISSVLLNDAIRLRTALSQIEGGFDSQLFRFKVDDGVVKPKITLSWNGYGEIQSGYPVTGSIWNFDTNAWEEFGNQDCPVDCTLSTIKKGSEYVSNNFVWVWMKAMNQLALPEISSLDSGIPDHEKTTITWETNIDSTSEVAYGMIPESNWNDYQFHSSDLSQTSSHSVELTGLNENTTYYFRVRSTSAADDTTTTDEFQFSTTGSSCPYIFTYDGNDFKFVTEASSPGILSLGTNREIWSENPFYKSTLYPNPLGNVSIPNGYLVPKNDNGEIYYDIRSTFELNEVNYLDEASLLVYDHSSDVEIYPDYRQNGILHSISNNSTVPFSVYDQNGVNVKSKIANEDNVFWQSPLSTQPSYLTIKLLQENETPPNLKFVIKKGKEGDFYNSMPGDKLQIKNSNNEFVDVPSDYNIFFSQRPGSLAKSVIVSNMRGLETKVVDLSGLDIKDNEIRLVTTNNKTQWDIDWISVDITPDDLGTLTKLSPYYADLHNRGISGKVKSVPNDPSIKIMQPDYSKLESIERVGNPLKGKATKYGDVTSLLSDVDNKFAVVVQGDEISMKYHVPNQPDGTQRDFVYTTWDYHKPYSYALGDEIGPLPFNEMTSYPYNTEVEDYPLTPENQAYIDTYNTRNINWEFDLHIDDLHHSLNSDYISFSLVDTYEPPVQEEDNQQDEDDQGEDEDNGENEEEGPRNPTEEIPPVLPPVIPPEENNPPIDTDNETKSIITEIGDVINTTKNSIVKGTKQVQKKTKEVYQIVTSENFSRKAQETGILTGIVATAAQEAVSGVSIMTQTTSLFNLPLLFGQFINNLLVVLGLKKKGKDFGYVYNSITKAPIPLAIIRFYDSLGNLITTSVTNTYGVFETDVKNGVVKLTVDKNGFTYPSTIVITNTDNQISNVYHGDYINLDNGVISNISIPLDPVDSLSQANKLKSVSKILFGILSRLLFIAGFIYSMRVYLLENSNYNLIVVLIYAIILLLFFISWIKSKSVGKVTLNGKVLKGIKVGIVLKKIDKIVDIRYTDEKGNYKFVVTPGEYEIRILDDNYIEDTSIISSTVVSGNKPKLVFRDLKVINT